MDTNLFRNLFNFQISLGFWIKTLGILFSAFYIVFAVIVVRQIRILNGVVEITAGKLLEVLSDAQLILAVVLFIYSLIIL